MVLFWHVQFKLGTRKIQRVLKTTVIKIKRKFIKKDRGLGIHLTVLFGFYSSVVQDTYYLGITFQVRFSNLCFMLGIMESPTLLSWLARPIQSLTACNTKEEFSLFQMAQALKTVDYL